MFDDHQRPVLGDQCPSASVQATSNKYVDAGVSGSLSTHWWLVGWGSPKRFFSHSLYMKSKTHSQDSFNSQVQRRSMCADSDSEAPADNDKEQWTTTEGHKQAETDTEQQQEQRDTANQSKRWADKQTTRKKFKTTLRTQTGRQGMQTTRAERHSKPKRKMERETGDKERARKFKTTLNTRKHTDRKTQTIRAERQSKQKGKMNTQIREGKEQADSKQHLTHSDAQTENANNKTRERQTQPEPHQ